jgi:uncharacterized protein DUF397
MAVVTLCHGAYTQMVSVVKWRKSSLSHPTECVEVGLAPWVAIVRDSKNATGPTVTLPTHDWMMFLAAVQRGGFD